MDRYPNDAQLSEYDPQDWRDHRIERGKQDRDRQLPGREDILGQTGVLARTPGHLYGQGAACQQGDEHRQLLRMHGRCRPGGSANRDRIEGSDRDDEDDEPAANAPDRPRPDSRSRACHAHAPGQGHALLRSKLAKPSISGLSGIAAYCGRPCALLVKNPSLTVNDSIRVQSTSLMVTSRYSLYWMLGTGASVAGGLLQRGTCDQHVAGLLPR